MAKRKNKVSYIYALIDPRTDKVRYVGRSVHPYQRINEHLGKSTGAAKQAWLLELKALGFVPKLIILEEVPINRQKLAEQFWITYHLYKGEILTNYALNHIGVKSIYYAAVLRYVGNESEFTQPSKLVLDVMSI